MQRLQDLQSCNCLKAYVSRLKQIPSSIVSNYTSPHRETFSDSNKDFIICTGKKEKKKRKLLFKSIVRNYT